jgi:hypothetical protein
MNCKILRHHLHLIPDHEDLLNQNHRLLDVTKIKNQIYGDIIPRRSLRIVCYLQLVEEYTQL